MNLTINAPEGSTTHGNPSLICTPPAWHDIIVFFFTNYVAHAATIISLPGQDLTETSMVAIAALLVPSSGIIRAVEIFLRRPSLRKGNQLSQAATAMALCMVVKVTEAEDGSKIDIDSTEFPWMEELTEVRDLTKIHGQCYLPKGYALAYPVPATAPLTVYDRVAEETMEGGSGAIGNKSGRSSVNIAASYNIPKAIISLAQAIAAIVTLYRSRGDQIERYGYAAFGLTVAPYAYMSIINLAATFLMPEYPLLYMVRTALMNEAEAKGGIFVGEVADLAVDQVRLEKDPFAVTLRAWGLGFLLSFPPLIIVGALSGFRPGGSSPLQRGFTMGWLVNGIFGGLWCCFWLLCLVQERRSEPKLTFPRPYHVRFAIFVVIPAAAPAIGGLVVVGRMVKEYGACVLLA